MKAAIIKHKGEMPVFTTFEEPIIKYDDECLVDMKAVAIKHLDKARASGKHYSSDEIFQPKVVGGDGVGILQDGTKVFGFGTTGTLAQKAVMKKNTLVKLPANIPDSVAAALPNAIAGSAMALLFRANMQRGETVLINGATGFTGRAAVQIAKHYGAGKIVVTGRNKASLESLLELGADEIILLNQDAEQFISQIKSINKTTGIDIVIDYLWGQSAEWILNSLKGNGKYDHKIRYVSIGGMGGETIQLSSQILRSSDIHLCGSGLGSWTDEEMQKLFHEIIPEIFQLAAENKFQVNLVEVPLEDIETLWQKEVESGNRLVVMI